MTLRRFFPAVWVVGLALSLVGVSQASENAAPAAKDQKAEASSKKPAKQPLEKDMPAEKIIELIGKPQEVTPMESKEGKAETWVYRRKIGTKSTQVVVGTRDVPAFVGIGVGNDSMQTRKEMIYGMKDISIVRVTSLLMFNDKLVLAKQWDEASEKYQ
jgi:hypothetical protein